MIDARADGFAEANRIPLAEHVERYFAHCEHAGQADKTISEKRRYLTRLLDDLGAERLSGLTPDAVEGRLRTMRESGLSARTVNFMRQAVVALMNWAQRTGRVERNPLGVICRLDESRNRRRVRRPLTEDELARLLGVAEPRGRAAWYLAAVLAGLRKGDLKPLEWRDLDF